MCRPLAVVCWSWVPEEASVLRPSTQVVYVSHSLLSEPVVEVAEGRGIDAHVVDDWFERGSEMSGYG